MIEVINTSGFYRVNPNIINELEYAPNFVYARDYSLVKEDKLSYTYPISGWYWFDTEVEAYTFFGIPIPLTEEEKQVTEETLEPDPESASARNEGYWANIGTINK